MVQRIITGAILLAAVALIMFTGNWMVGIVAMLVTFLSMYEEYKALKEAGHRPIAWPTWVTCALAVPLTHWCGIQALAILLVVATMITCTLVIFRHDPRLEDMAMSLLPLFSIVLPGLCIVSCAFIQPIAVQRIMLSIILLTPIVCDTAAYFGGSFLGKRKFCP